MEEGGSLASSSGHRASRSISGYPSCGPWDLWPRPLSDYPRMPFGLMMSQDVFQLHMDQILEHCPGTINIADNMVVFGRMEDAHDKNLINLVNVAEEHSLAFNSTKCKIKVNSIPFFGKTYNAHGVRPEPKKVVAIEALPAPANKEELHKFFGIPTYMGPYLPHFSQQLAPLRDLLTADMDFCWMESHQSRFDNITSQIVKCTTLVYFSPNIEPLIEVDASSRGLGAVLLQDGCSVAFISKALSDTEQRYQTSSGRCWQCYSGVNGFTITSTTRRSESSETIGHWRWYI